MLLRASVRSAPGAAPAPGGSGRSARRPREAVGEAGEVGAGRPVSLTVGGGGGEGT